MGIKTVPHRPYSPDLAPCDFWLFLKLRGCRYETIEEMKEAVAKVIDTLTQEHFHGAFQKLLERYNVLCSRRRLLRMGLEFHVCTINKSAHTKKNLETYRMPLVYIYIYIYIYLVYSYLSRFSHICLAPSIFLFIFESIYVNEYYCFHPCPY